MRARLRELEKRSRQLDPGPAARGAMARAVNDAMERFLTGLRDRGAYHGGPSSAAEDIFQPPEKPGDLGDALELIEEVILADGINPASGGHFGYISGGGLYPSALGDLIADVTNRYSGVWFASPGAVRLELPTMVGGSGEASSWIGLMDAIHEGIVEAVAPR